MTWYLSPAGWPTYAQDGSLFAGSLSDSGWLVIDEGQVAAAVATYNAGDPPPTPPDFVTVSEIEDPASPASVALRAASVAAVEDTTAVAPTGTWDFAQAPTVAGVAIGTGSGSAVEDVAAFGDSLTASTGTDWPTAVGTALGVNAVNAGQGGWASSDVAIRQGGLQPKLTVTSNTIPASGAVTVTAISPTTSFREDSTGVFFTWVGTLAGVPGTLKHTVSGSDGGWAFTRTAAGSAVSCPPGTPFICTEHDAERNRIQILWVGRNNLTGGGPALADVTRDLDLMIRNLTGDRGKRALVLGVTNTSSEPRGSANYTSIATLNAALAARYGGQFRDIRAWLIANALALTNTTPTAQDLLDLASDIMPTSLRADATHPIASVYTLIGQYVTNELKATGWITGQLPTVVPGAGATLTVGTPTATTVPLTLNTVTGATAYSIEARKTGTTAWSYLGNTTGTSFTATGLNAGTGYDFRSIPRNIAGGGTPSATVNATTTTPASVLTSDSFNRANTSTLGTSDIASGGTAYAWTASQIGIVGNQAGRTGLNGFIAVSTLPAGVTDGHAVVTVTVMPDTGEVALAGRSTTDGSTSYRLQVKADGTAYLARVVSNAFTVLSTTAAGAVAAGDQIELVVVGSTLTAVKNGLTLLGPRTDTGITTGTGWGIVLPNTTVPRLDAYALYSS